MFKGWSKVFHECFKVVYIMFVVFQGILIDVQVLFNTTFLLIVFQLNFMCNIKIFHACVKELSGVC